MQSIGPRFGMPPAHRPRLVHGTAHSLAHQFSMSAEHITCCCLHAGIERCRLDVIAGRFDPTWLNTARNLCVVRRLQATLRDARDRHPRVDLVEACLTLHLVRDPQAGTTRCSATFEAILSAADGRRWSGAIHEPSQLLLA